MTGKAPGGTSREFGGGFGRKFPEGGLDFLEVALVREFPYGVLPRQTSKKFASEPPKLLKSPSRSGSMRKLVLALSYESQEMGIFRVFSGLVKEFQSVFQGVFPYPLCGYPLWALPIAMMKAMKRWSASEEGGVLVRDLSFHACPSFLCLFFAIEAGSDQKNRAQRLTFRVRRPPGGVGVFHAKGGWPKSLCPASRACLPWLS